MQRDQLPSSKHRGIYGTCVDHALRLKLDLSLCSAQRV